MLVVLPYVSIVNEKSEHLEEVLRPMQASVRGFFGAEEKGQALAPRWVRHCPSCSSSVEPVSNHLMPSTIAALHRGYRCICSLLL